MNNYTVMLTSILHSAGKFGFTDNTKIGDLFTEEFDEYVWFYKVIRTFELFLGKVIPDNFTLDQKLTIEDLCKKSKELPELSEAEYAGEYFNISSRLLQAIMDRALIDHDETADERDKILAMDKLNQAGRNQQAFCKRIFGKGK